MNQARRILALPNTPGSAVGQATQIEQSRATAEVFAAVLAAKQVPRDEELALRSMQEACRMKELAERAFFRYSRAGSQVTGPTVHLARELARCWGNIHYGVSELSRDDERGQSEMQAVAWDLQGNARAASIFIVPHRRDKRGVDGGVPLIEARDIYENNANAGARRVRETIYSVLPLWFVERAQELCRGTLTDGGGKPLRHRIAEVIDWFGRIGVTETQLAEKVGKPATQWVELDLAPLGVIYRSIKNGEVSKDDEFPPATVTAADITGRTGQAQPTTPQPGADRDPPAPRQPEAPKAAKSITQQQSKRLHTMCHNGGISRETKLALINHLVRRDPAVQITTSADLTHAEADLVNTTLANLAKRSSDAAPLIELVIELIDRSADEPPAGVQDGQVVSEQARIVWPDGTSVQP